MGRVYIGTGRNRRFFRLLAARQAGGGRVDHRAGSHDDAGAFFVATGEGEGRMLAGGGEAEMVTLGADAPENLCKNIK